MLEAETLMEDVAQRRRRRLGPTHIVTLNAERAASMFRRERLGAARVDAA